MYFVIVVVIIMVILLWYQQYQQQQTTTLIPIGIVHSAANVKFLARFQPNESKGDENVIELDAKYTQALADLDGFTRIWVIWWFSRGDPTWKSKVMPPHGHTKRGLFATRTPNRPNRIAMTPVRLIRIEGNKLIIGDCDMLDGTPVIDIKPYIANYDSFPNESMGLVTDAHQSGDFEVSYTPLAEQQFTWLHNNGIHIREQIEEILKQDPAVNRTRRIKPYNEGFIIGCGAWRALFTFNNKQVIITRITPGYPKSALISGKCINNCKEQLEFLTIWQQL